jgi:colanic acid biosynthesis glycosyl transferase WcaI
VYYIADLWPESTRTAGLLREGPLYRLMRKTDSLLCRLSDAISTLSLALRRAIEDRGIPARKVEVIPFWLDPGKVSPQDRDNAWRRAQGIGPEQFVALYAGTIGFISGAGILVEVARRLRDRPDIVLLVVGEGPVKEPLQARTQEAGLTNLRFLPFQPAEDLSPMQASADVGLITLLPEAGENSVPSKMLGYLAAGRAVIASVARDSPTAEAILEGQCGRVVAPQQAEALAEAIRQAADDRPWVRAAGSSARTYFLANYSRLTITRRWEDLLRRLA